MANASAGGAGLYARAATASATQPQGSPRTPSPTGAAPSTVTLPATPTPLPTATSTVTPMPSPAVLIGAGDISVCGLYDDAKTAALMGRLLVDYPHAEFFTAGDNVQINGEAFEFNNCFDPTWGRFKDRIHPSPGNHDWYIAQGEAYFDYYGAAAGPGTRGFYSYDMGAWHIVSLNSNCTGEDCGENSWQAQWLREDLAQSGSGCTLLYWHHPAFNSGLVPIEPASQPLWQIAVEYGVDVVVNGHDHHYERFAPMNVNGNIDYVSGTRAFIVGTGGAWLFQLGDPLPSTEARDNDTFGLIQFFLYPDRYSWKFIPVEGGKYTDEGSDICR